MAGMFLGSRRYIILQTELHRGQVPCGRLSAVMQWEIERAGAIMMPDSMYFTWLKGLRGSSLYGIV